MHECNFPMLRARLINQGYPYCRIWHLHPPLFQLGKKTAINNKDQGVAESLSGGHRVRCFLSKRRNKKIEEFTMRHSGSRHFDCGVLVLTLG